MVGPPASAIYGPAIKTQGRFGGIFLLIKNPAIRGGKQAFDLAPGTARGQGGVALATPSPPYGVPWIHFQFGETCLFQSHVGMLVWPGLSNPFAAERGVRG